MQPSNKANLFKIIILKDEGIYFYVDMSVQSTIAKRILEDKLIFDTQSFFKVTKQEEWYIFYNMALLTYWGPVTT